MALNLDCFGTNYIGIRNDCDNTTPTSCLYINDLPGISLKKAALLTDSDTPTGVGLIRQFEQQAIRQVWIDLQNKLTEKVQFNKVVDQRQIGCFDNDDDETYLPVVAAQVGMKVQKVDCDPYTSIKINFVEIKADSTVLGKTLTITDGCTVQTYTFDIQACQSVKIYTNYTAQSKDVFITVDASDLELADLNTRSGSGNCNSCSPLGCSCETCMTSSGWDGTNEVSQGYGIIANVSCVCTGTEFLCSIQNEIAMAVQMRIGILLMQELLVSTRCNFFVQNTKEAAASLLALWMGGDNNDMGVTVKSEYWRILNQIAMGLRSNLQTINSSCVKCGTIRAIEALP